MYCVYRFWFHSLRLVTQRSRSVYIFMKAKRRCTSIVSAITVLIGVEKKTWLISLSRSMISTTAIVTHYAPPLEGFWTNLLVVVGGSMLIGDRIQTL